MSRLQVGAAAARTASTTLITHLVAQEAVRPPSHPNALRPKTLKP